MARGIDIGDKVAIIATAGKRIEDRVTLHFPTANYPYSIIDPEAKPGDKIRFEGEVVHVDQDLGRVAVQVLGRVTVDAGAVKSVKKCRRPKGTTPSQVSTVKVRMLSPVGGSRHVSHSAANANGSPDSRRYRHSVITSEHCRHYMRRC